MPQRMCCVIAVGFGRDGRVTASCERTVKQRRCPWSPLSTTAINARTAGTGPVVISLAVLFVTSVAGEIRCFCNQPSCVSTGYMCKSPLGLCFLETSSDGDLAAAAARTIHACAEALPEARRIVCATARDDVTSSAAAAAAGNLQKKQDAEKRRRRRRKRRSRQTNLICCGTDMCNYKPRLLINIHVSRLNVTSAPKETLVNRSLDVASHRSSADQQRLWFRICIIAVPLIGAVFLGFIVFAAARMFRKDRRRLHHCGSVGRHLPNDRVTTVPLANDTAAARKDGGRTVLDESAMQSSSSALPAAQYLTSVSPPLFRPSPVRQTQWRKQKVRPTAGNGLSAEIQISRRNAVLSNGLCPACVRDVYIVVDQRTY